mmetsp:Transcript_29985/g.72752  ORF Transcript_29985/g.72752 Transcript_29985/m.72752 type:complete len:81 (+) Transcript_29985:418-660(+)
MKDVTKTKANVTMGSNPTILVHDGIVLHALTVQIHVKPLVIKAVINRINKALTAAGQKNSVPEQYVECFDNQAGIKKMQP